MAIAEDSRTDDAAATGRAPELRSRRRKDPRRPPLAAPSLGGTGR